MSRYDKKVAGAAQLDKRPAPPGGFRSNEANNFMKQPPIQSTPVTRDLDRKGIPYRLFTHPGPIRSLEQAARERGQRPEQVVRSIVFRISEGEFVMVLIAGPQQITWPTLRACLGVSRMSMASEAEILAKTGYPLGAVSPFGLPSPMRILVDESVFQEEEISLGSGVRYTTVILSSRDLQRALGEVETGKFV
jgi:Cys-tRNA(Pro)/Cys-tRNA(Cys) deacylase